MLVNENVKFRPGCILVSEITDPDWVPIMKQAAGIITDHGGRTCHAAIVSRELGVAAVVGTGIATDKLKDGQMVTLCCDGSDSKFIIFMVSTPMHILFHLNRTHFVSLS